MSHRARRNLVLVVLLLWAAAVFTTGIGWGLPSRAADPFLFGEREPWTGSQILALASPRDDGTGALAADVDVNPLVGRDRPLVLNANDAQRAEIVRRYRLFSYQPDEMITFSALSQMNPAEGKLDPKLYQYGGLWIYPVGALLKIASMAGFVPLVADPAFYLDHPEAFGRFYVVARLYAAAWGLVGVWAVFWLTHRATLNLPAAAVAGLLYVCMPVVVNMSHEAKPHLPGTVLLLCAIVAATRFVESGRAGWWVATSALCGAAVGMVLSAAVILVVLPVMVMLRRDPWPRRLQIVVLGTLVAGLVYGFTNPFVPINLVMKRELLRSNFSNTAAMYEVGRLPEGVINAVRLVAEGASVGVLLLGTAAVFALSVRAAVRRRAGRAASPVAWLLAAPSAVVLVQFALLAAGKPGEYGRFAILPDVALGIAAACGIAVFARRGAERAILLSITVLLAGLPAAQYLLGFAKDSSTRTTRIEDAQWLRVLHERGGARTLGIYAEPAPYSLPPVDLFGWTLVLLPRDFEMDRDRTDAAGAPLDVIVRPVDRLGTNGVRAGPFARMSTVGWDLLPARISWAAKPFEVWVRTPVAERLRATHADAPKQ